MTTTLPTEYFTEAEAKRSVDCPNTMARDDGPKKCRGKTCGAWRWRHDGVEADSPVAVGFCGVGGRPR